MRPDPRQIARRAAGRALSERGLGLPAGVQERPIGGVHVTTTSNAPDAPERPKGTQSLVCASDLDGLERGAELHVPPDARLTDLCRDEARLRGIRLIEPHARPSAQDSAPERSPGDRRPLRIALGADHGGYPLKCDLVDWVRDLGHLPFDLGTHGPAAVDYPDFALAVAEAVAEGRADFGICVDGAGIGSTMAANKVPGARAANCYDTTSAKNAREHNFANVLCLAGPRLAPSLALEILRTFLATPTGAARHARRVEKITSIETRYRAR